MTKEQRPKKSSSFWIGPLVAGSFLATGYEVTQRFMILRENQQGQQTRELFVDKRPFPGKSLKAFRQDHAINSSKFEEKEMQTMLKALENQVNKPEIRSRREIQTAITTFTSQELPSSTNKQNVQKNNFDELFKTLPIP